MASAPTRRWKLPFITTWDDSLNQNPPIDSARQGSNETWRRERRSDLQLRTIENFSTLTSEYIQRSIADVNHKPSLEWFSAFCSVDASVKALFDDNVYASFKAVEVLVGENYGPGAIMPVNNFIETRDAAVKMMYNRVLEGDV
jgi:hypothetical protein